MGMYREDYLIYGIEVSSDDIANIMETNESQILPYWEGHHNVNCRIVGGGCNYKRKKIFGVILRSAEENAGFEDESPIKLDSLDFTKHIVECEYKDCFGKIPEVGNIDLYLISDWR